MSHVFARASRSTPPIAVGAEGCHIIDASGKRYLDASGGAAVSCLGHGDAEVIAAIRDQLDRLAYAHTGFFSSEPAEALADALIAEAPGDLDRVYLVSGGSEAIEAAIKLARQYCVETGRPERTRVIARQQSYHGNTLGALATGGNAARRAVFAPLLVETRHIPPCYAYRHQRDGEGTSDYAARAAATLEQEILAAGPETVMAFVAETVVGATLGAVPPVPGYFAAIREICDRYGVLLILDEVMCGMGRTGHLFACEAEGVAPDILCIAKGLGAGYQPIGAMLCTRAIHDAIAGGSGSFQHGHTYQGHPTAAAAGLSVLKALRERGLVARVRQQGARVEAALRDAFGAHPHVGDIRGRGFFWGIEFVADRADKTPFAPDRRLAARLKTAAFERGLICYPMAGTVDGTRGDHVLLAPPFIITDAETGEMIEKLAAALDSVI